MAAFGVNYNPSAVMMRPPGVAGQPYLGTGKPPVNNVAPGPTARPGPPASAGGTLGATAIRATGNTPGYDPSYAQNLATYGGGQFSGVTSFNPFKLSTFPGAPTGGGNAPIAGLPNTLLSQAEGGQAFSWNPPQASQTATAAPGTNTVLNMNEWLQQFLQGQQPGSAGTQ